MDSTVVNMLNNIPLGYFILFLITLVSGTVAITKLITSALTKHKSSVLREHEEQETRDEMLNVINTLQDSIAEIKSSMNGIREDFQKNDSQINERIKKLENDLDTLKDANKDKNSHLFDKMNELDIALEKLSDQVQLLIGSDKEAIEIYISNEYHKWMDQEEIDIYALEMIEKRFAQYKNEHGESFIEGLVKELRALPKKHLSSSSVNND